MGPVALANSDRTGNTSQIKALTTNTLAYPKLTRRYPPTLDNSLPRHGFAVSSHINVTNAETSTCKTTARGLLVADPRYKFPLTHIFHNTIRRTGLPFVCICLTQWWWWSFMAANISFADPRMTYFQDLLLKVNQDGPVAIQRIFVGQLPSQS